MPQSIAVPGVLTRRIQLELVRSVPGERIGAESAVNVVAISELIVTGVPQ